MNIPSVDTPARSVAGPGATASATADLLWAACRPEPDLEAAEAARSRGADLPWASRAAVAQRLSPLLWRVAQRWAAEGDEWAAQLRADSLRCKAQALMVRPRLVSELLEPLGAAGVQPMLIKGWAVADRYPEPGLRPMDDVDVLVEEHHYREAAEALRRAGWREAPRQGPDYSLSLLHPSMPGLPVDLHRELAIPAEAVFRFAASDLWAARRTTVISGAPAVVPVPEAELLLLATHAGKPYHNFDRLLWAVDASVIIGAAARAGRPIDWDVVAEASRRAAAGSALAVLLTQAGRLGADSPSQLREVKAGATRTRVLARPRSVTWPVERLDRGTRERLTYAVIDDPRLRLRRLGYVIVDDGFVRAPARAAVLTFRIMRRIWRFRRAGPASGPHPSAEQWEEQADPVLGDGEP